MALTYIAQRHTVEVVVLRRKQPDPAGRRKPSYLVLYSGAALAGAGRGSAFLARRMADELGRVRECAIRLASDYKYPNRPCIESVSDVALELRELRGVVFGLLNRELRLSRGQRLLQALGSAQEGGRSSSLAIVIDHASGAPLPRIVWPSVAAQRPGVSLQRPAQAQRMTALSPGLAQDLADSYEFFVRSM